jgi:hypothetical protein
MEWFKSLSLRVRLIAASGAALVIIGAAVGIIAVANSGSSGKSAAETPASEAEITELEEEFGSAEEEAFEECLTLWNGPENVGPRNEVNTLEASYASITLSELYPDKCLITAANPQINLAAQYLQIEGGPYAFKNQASGEATSLPATVTEWNATANEGYLRMKPWP